MIAYDCRIEQSRAEQNVFFVMILVCLILKAMESLTQMVGMEEEPMQVVALEEGLQSTPSRTFTEEPTYHLVEVLFQVHMEDPVQCSYGIFVQKGLLLSCVSTT